ncbi:MAG: TIGR00282 family metallophosphoesterase [Clostridia bacterium]
MKILVIGDVVGSRGCEFIRDRLSGIKRSKEIDIVIANGENSADGNGITPSGANYLFDSGVDLISLGNHTYRRHEICDYLDETEHIIRPANFPSGAPGKGFVIYDMGRWQICLINLMGTSFMEPLDCPFAKLDEILKNNDLPKIKIVDFHAEATGEKRAFGFYADGRVSAVFGTHTHVQTADESILPNGTGYITDVGMVGSVNSVLGVKSELIIRKLKTKLPVRFDYAQNEQEMNCIILDIDKNTGKCLNIERMIVR